MSQTESSPVNRHDCDHENADWQARPEPALNGITYHGQCVDCGAPLEETWFEKVLLYQDEEGEWHEF